MLSNCRPRKSSNHGKPVGYYSSNNNRRHTQQHCLRHPIVVFCISFLVLGSLRFRVRTKQAAANLIQRGRQRISGHSAAVFVKDPQYQLQQNQPQQPQQQPQQRTIAYELVTEGKHHIQHYRAVWVETSTTVPKKGLQRLQNLSRKKSTPVTVYEWTQHMLLSSSSEDDNEGEEKETTLSLLHQFIQVLQSGNDYPAYFFETKSVTAANAQTKPFEFVLVDAPQLQSFVQSNPSNEQPFGIPMDACRAKQQQQQQNTNKLMSCVFPNLGGDATLIAPLRRMKPPTPPLAAYTHLANFVRQAPYDQVHDFWRLVLETYMNRLAHTTTNNNNQVVEKIVSAAPTRSRRLKKTENESQRQTPNTSNQQPQQQQPPPSIDDDEPVWLSTSGMGVAWLHMRLDRHPKYYTYQPFVREQ